MSKGLGIWERRIMQAIERDGYAYPGAMAEALRPGSLAARQAALRAATSLSNKGLAEAGRYWLGKGPKVIVWSIGRRIDGRPQTPNYEAWIMATDESITAA